MSSVEPPAGDPQPQAADQPQHVADQPQHVTEPAQRSPNAVVVGLVCSLVAAAITWFLLQAVYPFYAVPPELLKLGPNATAEDDARYRAAEAEVARKNAMVALALVGAVFGAGLGVAEGISRRLPLTAVAGAIAGAVGGGLLGLGGGWLTQDVYLAVKPIGEPLTLLGTALMLGTGTGLMGLGIGLGVGIAAARLRRLITYTLAGLIAGVFAGFFYALIAGLFPDAQTEQVVPVDRFGQALLVLVIALTFGAIVTSVTQSPAKRPVR